MTKITIDTADIEKYLSPKSQRQLKILVESINIGRQADGKETIGTVEVADYEYSPFFNRGKY